MARYRDEDDDDDRPRRRRRRDDDDDRPRRSKGLGLHPVAALVVAGGILSAVLVLGIGLLWLLTRNKVEQVNLGPPNPQPLVLPQFNPNVPAAPPVPAGHQWRLAPGVVSIPVINPRVTGLFFGGGEDGFAAIVSTPTQGGGKQFNVVRTATGEARGQVTTDQATGYGGAVSPDGKWLAVIRSAPSEGHAVVVYSVSDGQLAREFTPYRPAPGVGGVLGSQLVWVALLPGDRLLTIHSGGGFDIWSVPALQRIGGYAPPAPVNPPIATNFFTICPTNFALTPDGKTLALFNGTGFSFFDVATATETARTEAVMKAGWPGSFWGAALRSDGDRFACFCSTFTPAPTDAFYVWEPKTGKQVSKWRSKLQAPGCAWWGPDHLVLWQGGLGRSDVFSVATGQVVAKLKFDGIGKFGTVPPSGKLWGVTGGALNDPVYGAAVLAGVSPPAVMNPTTNLVLSPEGLVAK